MLQVNFIRQNKAKVLESLQKRHADLAPLLDQVITLDDTRKSNQQALDQLRAESNSLSKEIGQLYKQGKREEAEIKKSRATAIRDEEHTLKAEAQRISTELQELLLQLPNVLQSRVPAGKSENENIEHQAWTQPLPSLMEQAQPHWELAKTYNLIDFELGAKISGSGFPVYTGLGAKLQRALISFFLDQATQAGYTEFMPPLLVNEDSVRGTGQFPDKEGQMYHTAKDDLYLIPTSEVPLTNIFRDVILKENDLPIRMTAYTPCFRREAGSYGSHVRGLNRLHQFDKVELVQIQHPERSNQALEEMCGHVEQLLQALELPYRILLLCSGDTGFTSAVTFDFETYSAAQERWLEVSSVSNFETFQANRLQLRFEDENRKKHLAHTLNGSALALPRILATLLENNQTETGIKIPKALQPYTGFDFIPKP